MLTETIISARGESYGVITPTGVNLRTFVSEDCGAASLSTGIATFVPRSYLPYHLHAFSEAITVLEGAARILIEGRTYILSERDCIHVPAATAHQVENADKLGRMVALWAFASAKPTRTQVEKCFLLEYRGYGNPKEGDPESIIRFDQCPVYELSENAAFLDLFARTFLTSSSLSKVPMSFMYSFVMKPYTLPVRTRLGRTSSSKLFLVFGMKLKTSGSRT